MNDENCGACVGSENLARVVIVQELLAEYRVQFYERLRSSLAARGVCLELVHGRAVGYRARFGDESAISWAKVVTNRIVRVGGGRHLVWQPVLLDALRADLVVVEQANRHILNFLLAFAARKRLALWGHGEDLQEGASRRVSAAVKRLMASRCTWWFAYTEGTASRIGSLGFPMDRVTAVQNAVDFEVPDRVDRVEKLCVYVGSLHRYKRLDFLIEAGAELNRQLKGFKLVVAGDGPDRELVAAAAAEYDWLEFVGRVDGKAKTELLCRSQLVLMPGLVGLVAVESFAAQSPVVTIADTKHSPEFEYLNDRNSLVVRADCTASMYAEAVSGLLRSRALMDRLRAGCAASAENINVDEMVRRFTEGVVRALDLQDGSRMEVAGS